VAEVIRAAHFRGELAAPWERLLRGLAARGQAEAQRLEADWEKIQARADQFRYERDLITSEETELWLTERDLALEDLEGHCLRAFWLEELGKWTQPAKVDFAAASAEWRALLRVELRLTEQFERLARNLIQRVLARPAEGRHQAALSDDKVKSERQRFYRRAGLSDATLERWLTGLGRDTAWLTEMLELEVAYQGQCDQLLTSEARAQTLRVARLALVRFEAELIDLESHEAAREAYLCVREDGRSMAELAKEAGYPYRRVSFVLEDLREEVQQHLLNARAGAVIEPWEQHGGFQLCRVVAKKEPSLRDSRIRSRVDQRILESYFAALEAREIQWPNRQVRLA
jgi:hypothetical protein